MNKDELKKSFEDKGIPHVFTILEPYLKNAINISLEKAEESAFDKGQSKIGGLPDLPPEIEWPEYKENPMSFIAQINLSEVKNYDADNKLPQSGILYFFYESENGTWGFSPEDKESSKVYYYKGDTENLEKRETPENLDEYYIFKPCKLSFKTVVNCPNYQSSLMNNVELSEKDSDILFDFMDEEDCEINKLLGHSDNIQDGMELECELVTNGLYCGDSIGYNDPKAKELEKNTGLWQLLLQVDSNDDAGMMWGDTGRLYFWIRENDLKEEKFENSWLILQCY